jgi:hypothetical protein
MKNLWGLTWAGVVLLGCSHQDSIVGKWRVAKATDPAVRSDSVEYRPDGTFVEDASVGGMHIHEEGTYTVLGDKIRKHESQVWMELEDRPGGARSTVKGLKDFTQTFTVSRDSLTIELPQKGFDTFKRM